MEIKSYLAPANLGITDELPSGYEKHKWGSHIKIHTKSSFPDLDGVNIAILGVGEFRNSLNNEGCAGAPDKVREYFYNLSAIDGVNVADIGNLIPGNTPNDTYFAVEFVCSELLTNNIIPFIIGGSQDLTFANYLAYQKLRKTINLVCIDRKIDLVETLQADNEELTTDSKMPAIDYPVNDNSYLGNIINHSSGMLFNLSLVAYQSYFVNSEETEMLQKMYFDVYRLGYIQSNMEEAEPIVRSADILSFDISSIRQSDAPACANTTPNGLYGEEACQIMRYAGMSDKLSSAGIYELNPLFDNRGQTAHLAAQMLWYFMEGFSNRKNDFPVIAGKDYVKYIVTIRAPEHEIVFYKSLKTDRWWMEVPKQKTTGGNLDALSQPIIIACSYDDYLLACSEEMPDRWWQAYQKLN